MWLLLPNLDYTALPQLELKRRTKSINLYYKVDMLLKNPAVKDFSFGWADVTKIGLK